LTHVEPIGPIAGSPTGDLFDAATYTDWVRAAVRIREAGDDVSILFESTMSEPTAELMDVVRHAFSAKVTSRYVSVFADGNSYARRSLAGRYGLAVDEIITTTGAIAALKLLFKTFVQPGDRVLIENPSFDVLAGLAAEAEAEIATVERPWPKYSLDLDDLAAKLTPRTRLVIVTNLHNPTGARLTPAEIARAGELLAGTGAILVVDEVYSDFAEPIARPACVQGRNIVTVSSLTKVFGLFALKFGWIAANQDLIGAIKAAAPDGDIGVSKLAHAVAAHVLEQPEPFEAHWKRALAATRPLVAEAAARMREAGLIEGDVPALGCMYFPRVVGVSDTRALARRLLHEHGLLVAPGEYFGAPGHLRIGFGGSAAAIGEGLRRLEAGLGSS
jgi:aspartate/methionine/tyrosine aminotransferase